MEQLIQGILKSDHYPALLVNIVRWRLFGSLVDGIQQSGFNGHVCCPLPDVLV